MSFSRLNYDVNAYDLKLDRAVKPGDYRLFRGFGENCVKCHSYDGPRNAISDRPTPKVDNCDSDLCALTTVESLLQNRNQPLTESNERGNTIDFNSISLVSNNNCSDNLNFEDTRFTYPIEAFRCMDTTEFHYNPYLSVNPQCEVREDRIGSNSRLKVKDNWKPRIPEMPDQSVFLPPETAVSTNNLCK